MKFYTLSVLFLVSVLMIACSDNDTPAAEENIKETPVVETPVVISNVERIPLWQNYMEQQFPDFSDEDFSSAYTVPLETFPPYPINESELNFFKPYLAYNADSTKAIDIYSYSSVTSNKGGERVYMNGGPDAQINLVNTKDNTSQRLFFSGPMLSFWDAKWIDSNKVIITGTEEKTPVYWIMDLKLKSMELYSMDSVQRENSISREAYLRRKMPGVIIPG